MTTRCHSVFSLRSPVALSRQLSEVATLRFAIGRPSWVRRISGSLPRFPTRITLFTLPAITALHSRKILAKTASQVLHQCRRRRRPYTLQRAPARSAAAIHTYSSDLGFVPGLFL